MSHFNTYRKQIGVYNPVSPFRRAITGSSYHDANASKRGGGRSCGCKHGGSRRGMGRKRVALFGVPSSTPPKVKASWMSIYGR
jgi:hypothetical protein